MGDDETPSFIVATLLITVPIFACGYAASKWHLAWAIAALVWHFIAPSLVFPLAQREEE